MLLLDILKSNSVDKWKKSISKSVSLWSNPNGTRSFSKTHLMEKEWGKGRPQEGWWKTLPGIFQLESDINIQDFFFLQLSKGYLVGLYFLWLHSLSSLKSFSLTLTLPSYSGFFIKAAKHNGKRITTAVSHYWLWLKLFTRLLTGTMEKKWEREQGKEAGFGLLPWISASTPLNRRLTSYDGPGLRYKSICKDLSAAIHSVPAFA